MFKHYFKKLTKDLKNKKKIKDSFYFLLYFLFSFFLFYLFFAKSIFYKYINYFYGAISSKILNFIFNIPSMYYFDVFNNHTLINIPSLEFPIAIIFLCTGILELSLILSAIVSTIGPSLNQKIRWIFLSIFIVVIFNLLRITLTILIITSFNLSIANIFHGVLFRLFLIIIVIGIYYFYLKNSF